MGLRVASPSLGLSDSLLLPSYIADYGWWGQGSHCPLQCGLGRCRGGGCLWK